MPSPDIFYLSLASVSAVLLGICVTLRNNAFATILRHFNEEIRLGARDYEVILERSAYGAMASGFFFALTIILAFGGLFMRQGETLGGNWFRGAMLTFAIGLLSLIFALFTGHINLEWPFRSPSKPDRSDRPELEEEK